jgi:putative ABC transport system permease protein
MSAVWRASRAAVRRRRLQTFVIGVVILFCTATMVLALALVAASTGPFDQGYSQQRGAHLVAAFDNTKVSDAQLMQAARKPGVEAVAGPFGQVVLDDPGGVSGLQGGDVLTVVGRADPAGPVDRLTVSFGRWATGPGEIVLNETPGFNPSGVIGSRLTFPGRPKLTVVGIAYSVSQSAGAWVTPAEMTALHPTAAQMLYRFKAAATPGDISAGLASVTAGFPAGALTGSQSYLVIKQAVAAGPGTMVPFLMVFGILGLAVAVLIVGNVVSGAVIAGFRHIGVLKALGFTPDQVTAVYLIMLCVPAILGCTLGTAVGGLAAKPLLHQAFDQFGSGNIGVAPWADAAGLVGMPALVLLTAALPALRARRLSAVQALNAGAAQHAGRALAVQRRLTGARLPRSISLGLAMPFARPGRSALTVAAVVLGVATVTFASGLADSLTAYGNAANRSGGFQVIAWVGDGTHGEPISTLSAPVREARLQALPGTRHIYDYADLDVGLSGYTSSVRASFIKGDVASLGYVAVNGSLPAAPDEAMASGKFLRQRGLAVGDSVTLDAGGRQARVTIVGEDLSGEADELISTWATLATLAPDKQADSYDIQITPGSDITTYLHEVRAADPGLIALPQNTAWAYGIIMTAVASTLTLMLGIVSALGVFNTVVLNTRERRRDLGILKSIGMTPRQVTSMLITSMAALGAIGSLLGVPLGIAVHREVMPLVARAAGVDVPNSMLDVWHAPLLAQLALAGLAIAVLGALIPARSAARLTIAQVLRSE